MPLSYDMVLLTASLFETVRWLNFSAISSSNDTRDGMKVTRPASLDSVSITPSSSKNNNLTPWIALLLTLDHTLPNIPGDASLVKSFLFTG